MLTKLNLMPNLLKINIKSRDEETHPKRMLQLYYPNILSFSKEAYLPIKRES